MRLDNKKVIQSVISDIQSKSKYLVNQLNNPKTAPKNLLENTKSIRKWY